MRPYLAIGSLVIANHTTPVANYELRTAAFPGPDLFDSVAACLEGRGTPVGELYDIATRLLGVDCLGSSEALALASASALLRATAPGATLSLRGTPSDDLLTTTILHGNAISSSYEKTRRALGKMLVSVAIVTEPYWHGPSVTVTGGALTYAAPSRNLTATMTGDLDPYLAVSLTGLVNGRTYTLTHGTGKVTFTATATSATIEGRTFTGMNAPAIYVPLTAKDGTNAFAISGIGVSDGTVTLAATYKPRYLSA